MAEEVLRRFMQVESSQIPLMQVDYDEVKKNCIDPITKKPYKGIILFGVFADLAGDEANNNLRFYDIPSYVQMVGELRQKVHSPKGVYGELEHPEGYAVNYKRVSHKILDIYYDESKKQVLGYVLLLNTENGKKAQEIVRSGGCLAISARAAGEENKQPDGTKQCRVKLLTTYDLVYHPGFAEAVLQFKELNESQKFFEEDSKSRRYSMILFDDQVKKLNESYNHFVDIYSGKEQNKCFFTWLNESQSNLEKQEEERDEKKMQKDDAPDEKKIEGELERAAQKDLKQSQGLKRRNLLKRLQYGQQTVRKRLKKQGNAVYDDSAGFITEGMGGIGVSDI